jgi:hypothetical protein
MIDLSDGRGYAAMDYATAFLVLFAGMLQVAVLRDNRLTFTKQTLASRWCVAAATLGIGARLTVVLVTRGDLMISLYMSLSLLVYAIGSIGMSIENLRVPKMRRRASDSFPHTTWQDSQRVS